LAIFRPSLTGLDCGKITINAGLLVLHAVSQDSRHRLSSAVATWLNLAVLTQTLLGGLYAEFSGHSDTSLTPTFLVRQVPQFPDRLGQRSVVQHRFE